MASGIVRRAAEALMRPQIRDFVHLKALRMGETELLAGAKAAATSVQAAMHASLLDKDDSPLDELLRSGSLAPSLHAALSDEVRRGRTEGDAVLELMISELSLQREAVATGHASIGNHLLVAGMQRQVAESGSMAGFHRMHLGSHLLVIDQQPSGLWRYERQRSLMQERGVSVQLEIHFDAPSSSQTYTLEANLDGDDLADDDQAAAGDERGLQFLVADLNSMTGGAFWSATSRVSTFMDPTDPMNPP